MVQFSGFYLTFMLRYGSPNSVNWMCVKDFANQYVNQEVSAANYAAIRDLVKLSMKILNRLNVYVY